MHKLTYARVAVTSEVLSKHASIKASRLLGPLARKVILKNLKPLLWPGRWDHVSSAVDGGEGESRPILAKRNVKATGLAIHGPRSPLVANRVAHVPNPLLRAESGADSVVVTGVDKDAEFWGVINEPFVNWHHRDQCISR